MSENVILVKRKLVKINGTYYLSLPKDWIEKENAADKTFVVIARKSILAIPIPQDVSDMQIEDYLINAKELW